MEGRYNTIQIQPQLKRESNGRIVVCRRGTPISHAFTLAANLKEQSDSPTEATSGERFTNINVLESPPRQGCLSTTKINQFTRGCPSQILLATDH